MCRAGVAMSFHWNLQEDLRSCGEGRHFREVRSVRLRRMEIAGRQRDVVVRLVQSRDAIQAACDLINDRYAWRGYGASHRIPIDPYHMTFTAECDGEVIGTITLAMDSPAGLAIDRTFKGEVDEFRRAPGAKLCELTKFAFSPTIQSKELMATLFHIVFVYGRRTFGGTDLFIEVNPRHVRFYEAMLGFERIGSLKANESVAAPAQLMRLKVACIREYIDRFAGSADQHNTRSLYPYFFSPDEENGIYRRLMGTDPEALRRPYEIDAPIGLDAAAFLDSCRPGNHSASATPQAAPDPQLASR